MMPSMMEDIRFVGLLLGTKVTCWFLVVSAQMGGVTERTVFAGLPCGASKRTAGNEGI
jgi:hypothetical protein